MNKPCKRDCILNRIFSTDNYEFKGAKLPKRRFVQCSDGRKRFVLFLNGCELVVPEQRGWQRGRKRRCRSGTCSPSRRHSSPRRPPGRSHHRRSSGRLECSHSSRPGSSGSPKRKLSDEKLLIEKSHLGCNLGPGTKSDEDTSSEDEEDVEEDHEVLHETLATVLHGEAFGLRLWKNGSNAPPIRTKLYGP